ncbi:MAG: helix-turn-helix transcriptional regulator [Rickettsiales bacterium]|nr:helix-turn-helix transcriptional regulator [Rickettsiales bacterium]
MVTKKKEKDAVIGSKLRQLRNIKGISQSVLANEAGITFQQVQKYEKGVNRISAGRLHDFAEILGVDVNTFYNEFGDYSYNQDSSNKKFALAEDNKEDNFQKNASEVQSFINSKETTTLLREFFKIKDIEKRKNIIEFIKAMNRSEK